MGSVTAEWGTIRIRSKLFFVIGFDPLSKRMFLVPVFLKTMEMSYWFHALSLINNSRLELNGHVIPQLPNSLMPIV